MAVKENDMLNKWMCLMIALILSCAPLTSSLAEALIIEDWPGEIPGEDAAPEELPGEMGDVLLFEDDPIGGSRNEEPELLGEFTDPEDAGSEGFSVDNGLVPLEEDAASNAGASLILSAEKLTIGVGENCTALTATLGDENSGDVVTWSSSKKSVARVGKGTGVITGVKAGSATWVKR